MMLQDRSVHGAEIALDQSPPHLSLITETSAQHRLHYCLLPVACCFAFSTRRILPLLSSVMT